LLKYSYTPKWLDNDNGRKKEIVWVNNEYTHTNNSADFVYMYYHCCGPRAVHRQIWEEKTSSTHKYVKEIKEKTKMRNKNPINRLNEHIDSTIRIIIMIERW